MKLAAALLAFGLIALPVAAQAEDRGTREEAIAMCEKVKADYLANGEEATFKAVTEEKKYNNKDLYPFIYNMEGVVVAHGQKPNMVGLNRLDARDQLQGGKLYIQEFVELMKKGQPGWVSYKFLDPLTKTSLDKESYLLPINDKIFVGVGVYKDAAK